MVIMPWLIWRSLMFNMKVTSFSNVHFSFQGTLKRSYAVFLGYPLLGYLLLIAVAVVVSILGPSLESIDETVLDNSAYNARMVETDGEYTKDTWIEWGKELKARPVPGAVDFFNYAKSKGVAIYYLSNRYNVQKKETIQNLKKELEFDAEVPIIDPRSDEFKEMRATYALKLWELRKRKGETKYSARVNMGKRNYFGAMMLKEGDADGMISGYSRAYPKVLRPVFEVLGRAKNVQNASTVNIMITDQLFPCF